MRKLTFFFHTIKNLYGPHSLKSSNLCLWRSLRSRIQVCPKALAKFWRSDGWLCKDWRFDPQLSGHKLKTPKLLSRDTIHSDTILANSRFLRYMHILTRSVISEKTKSWRFRDPNSWWWLSPNPEALPLYHCWYVRLCLHQQHCVCSGWCEDSHGVLWLHLTF